MILPVFGERPASFLGAAGLSWGHRFRLIAPALTVFGLSLMLPAVQFSLLGGEPDPAPGYMAAVWAESLLFEFGMKLARSAAATPPSAGNSIDGAWPYFAGAAANHLFVLACLAVQLCRFRIATSLAALSTFAASCCLLPLQILGLEPGLSLAPGYYVWCTAPVVLMVSVWRGKENRGWKRLPAHPSHHLP